MKPKKSLQIDGNTLSIKDNANLADKEPHGVYENLTALRRRGLAFHFADLMSWRVHERYIASLMDRMAMDPPPGYARTSLTQVLRADRQAFMTAMTEVTSFARDPAGKLPLDDFFANALSHLEVGFHLHYLPLLADKGKGKGKWLKQERTEPYQTGAGKGTWSKSGGKGKGNDSKGKGKGFWRMPAALKEHGTPSDENEEPLCYGFNLGTCTAAPAGGRCEKGKHLCCFKGCLKPHSYLEHAKSQK